MLLKIHLARWPRGLANASMNLNFCVRWPRQIASGDNINCGLRIFDCGLKAAISRGGLHNPQSAICKPQAP